MKNDAYQLLLILGKPGSGKSTLLLELAYHLTQQAEQDATQLLPVLLPLSSWATKQRPLSEWLIEQFTQLYNVPQELSQQWMATEQLLPLLDGLDEMEEAARPACIAAINAYHRQHLHPLVVCCRTNEYETATEREKLSLNTAIVIQSLPLADIHRYLESLGPSSLGLRTALDKNATLQEVVTTPLMLQVLLLTYHDTPVWQHTQGAPQLLQQIWLDYVKRMINLKGNASRYPLQATIRWLNWLAQYMRAHNQTIFVVEPFQWRWLVTERYVVYRLFSILLGALLGMLLGTLLGMLLGGLIYGLLGGLIYGLYIELLYPFVHKTEGEGEGKTQSKQIPNRLWKKSTWSLMLLAGSLIAMLSQGLMCALFGGVVGLFYQLMVRQIDKWPSWLFDWLLIGMTYSLFAWAEMILQDFLARLWLCLHGSLPLRSVPFLEDATARILLRRVGSDYSFTHRLLLDFFADLDPHGSSSPSAAGSLSLHQAIDLLQDRSIVTRLPSPPETQETDDDQSSKQIPNEQDGPA